MSIEPEPQAAPAGNPMLQDLVRRAERLQKERDDIDADLKAVIKEAKGLGFDAFPAFLKRRRQDRAANREQNTLLDLYDVGMGGQ